LRPTFQELFYAGWLLSAIAFTGVLGFLATFSSFGFDKLDDLYPFIAEGWGLWYWLAQVGLGFTTYLFIVNTALAALIFRLAVPLHRRTLPLGLCLLTIAYFVLWFQFGQARYGMALALLAPAAVSGGWLVFWVCGLIAVLIHKGVAGAVLLLCLWRILRNRRKGLIIAVAVSIVSAVLVHSTLGRLLELAGYANYRGWVNQQAANTPIKYFYLIAVFFLLRMRQKKDAASLLTLAVVFLPTAYYNVFAGRGFQACSAVLFAALLETSAPWYIQLFIMIPYVIELVWLLLYSGLYF
jgi:hypothetical protein